MARKVTLGNLGKIQLRRLRKDIVLNSLFIHDYENRYGLDPHAVCNFFDGFVEYLSELEREKYGKEIEIDAFFKEFDTPQNLEDYYYSIEWPQYE